MTSRRLLLAGLLASTLVTLGGTGAGALPPSGWDVLRSQDTLAVSLTWAGVALLCLAWWGSRGEGVRHQRAACVLWALPLLAAPPLFSRDLYAYAGQAALVAEGRDPYAVGPGALPGPLSAGVDEVWLDAPAPYGPVWLALAGLVVRATGDALVPALLGLRLLAVVGLALLGWALTRLARDVSRALWLGIANPLVLLHLVAGGHNDALMIGLLAAGVAVVFPAGARREGSASSGPVVPALVAAAALITLATLVKAPAVAALAYLPLVVASWPARARAAVVVAATAVVTAVVAGAGTGLGWGWLGTLDAGRARLSLFSPLTGLGQALGALDAVLTGGLVAAAGLCVALLCAAALGRLDPVTALGLTLMGVSVLLPVVQPWYLLWGTCLLAARIGPRGAAVLGAASLVLCLTIAPSGRNVIRPPLYGLPTVLAAAAGLAVLRRPERRGVPAGLVR